MWRIILSGDLRMDYRRAEEANGAGLDCGDCGIVGGNGQVWNIF